MWSSDATPVPETSINKLITKQTSLVRYDKKYKYLCNIPDR